MTTEHQDDQRRGGGFREAVNELFGRNEGRDPRDTSQLDALDRDEAQRHGDVNAGDPVAEPDSARHAYGDQAAVAQPGQYGDSRVDDPAQQTTPGVRFDAGDPAAAGTADAHTGDAATGHGDPLADDVTGRQATSADRYDDAAVGDRPVDPAGDLGAQRTPPQGQPVMRDEHLGDAQTPHGGEVRGDTVAPEHVRHGGDPTAQGQVQHGGELRGDPAGTRSDADLAAPASTRDADVDAGATTAGAGTGTAAAAAGAGAGTAAAHHSGSADASDDGERAALVTRDRAESYGARWDSVKGEFVDEPRRAVADADALVGELLDELQELFKQQRTQIEQGLDADETSTEDLRLALRRYRSFFDRLLSI
jgi:hypothetical protein